MEIVNDNLWLGTVAGLFILKDIVGIDINNVKDVKVLHLNSDTYEATGLPSAIVIKVLQDKAGVVWAGTFRQGAFRYHSEYADGHFQPVYNSERKHQDNYSTIWGFGENSDGDIFLVSQQRGLGKYLGQMIWIIC